VSVVANVAINVDSSNAVSKLRQVQQGAQATSQAVDRLNATTAATSDKFKIAANGIKYYTDATGRARAENGRFLTTAERVAAGINAQGDAAQRATGQLSGLRNALAGLGAGLALRKSFVDASELESAQSRVELLSKNFQQFAGIQEVAANAAKKFNLSQSEALGALTDLGNRIGPTGASLEDVANVYEGFNTLLALNKVNAASAASATLQLNQALGSGRLAGEEFNAISEATPQLLDAVAQVLGRNRSELKQLASDGQISSQVLIEALRRIRTEGAADLETAFGGAFGATRQFNAALEDFSATVGTELLPAITPIINKATEILKLFGELPGPIKTTAVAVVALTAAFVALAPAIAAISLASAPWLALAAGIAALTVVVVESANAQQEFNNTLNFAPIDQVAGKVNSLKKELAAAELKLLSVQSEFGAVSREAAFAEASVDALRGALEQAQGEYKVRLLYQTVGVTPDARFYGPGFKAPAPKPQRTAPVMPTPRASGATGANRAADEAKRREEELKQSIKRGDELFRQLSRQAVLLGTISETERKRLQIQYDYQDRAREINELKDAQQKANLMEVNDEIRRLETLKLQTEELRKQLQLFYELAGVPMGEMLPGGAGAFRTDINLDPSDRAQQKIDEYKEKLAELQDPINMAQRGAQAIGDAFSSSFQGIITGTQSVQEALASFFQNVAKSFIDMATEIIAQMVIMYAFKQLLGLFGGGATGIGSVGNFSGAFNGGAASFNAGSFGMDLLPGRAKGGPVSGGQMYMVGERGPELFVPGRSGTIVANDKMGGSSTNVVVNVDAKGSSVEGNEQGANQLGRLISAAVQSELIKQQRPGGLLAR
jgi:tape measure domain-containing protein